MQVQVLVAISAKINWWKDNFKLFFKSNFKANLFSRLKYVTIMIYCCFLMFDVGTKKKLSQNKFPIFKIN